MLHEPATDAPSSNPAHGTDPLLGDTDGDSFEIRGGTDPLDPESFPTSPVPALGPASLGVLALLLGACVWLVLAGAPKKL